jgi:hypothetical protein
MYGCFGSSTINNVEIDTSLNLSLNALDIPDIILSDLMFAKAILLGSNKPDLPLWFTLKPFTESECIIGDTIVLMCGVNGNWNPDNLIVKVSTSDETKNFLLTLNQDVGYILNYPNSHKCYTAFIPYIQSLPDGRTDSVIRVNQKGDILTAEIEYLNQKLTTTLKMKEK